MELLKETLVVDLWHAWGLEVIIMVNNQSNNNSVATNMDQTIIEVEH